MSSSWWSKKMFSIESNSLVRSSSSLRTSSTSSKSSQLNQTTRKGSSPSQSSHDSIDFSETDGGTVSFIISSINTTIPEDNKYFHSLVSKLRKRLRIDPKDDAENRQYWMPDSNAKECYECGDKFTALRRRHHCRICGQIFCSKCCNDEIDGLNDGSLISELSSSIFNSLDLTFAYSSSLNPIELFLLKDEDKL